MRSFGLGLLAVGLVVVQDVTAQQRFPTSPSTYVAGQTSLAEIREKGYVRVCADPANLPFSSSYGGTPGFEVELAKAVAAELGVEAQFQWILTWVRPVWELRKGNCDLFLGLPPTARFKQSNPWIAVSRPYYTMTYAILTRSDAGVAGLADLNDKRVAVDAGRPPNTTCWRKGWSGASTRGRRRWRRPLRNVKRRPASFRIQSRAGSRVENGMRS